MLMPACSSSCSPAATLEPAAVDRLRSSSATQEDPLGDRLEELQSQAMVVAARTHAAQELGGRGSTGSCI